MKLETRVFELSNGKYANLSQLAKAMGISLSQVYRVREGKRGISRIFIIGAIKAFPGYKLDDLFYVVPEASQGSRLSSERMSQVVNRKPALQKPAPGGMLTISDVARLLNIHITTVRRWSKKGMLKAYRIGSRGDRRFRREDVDRFLKEGEIE